MSNQSTDALLAHLPTMLKNSEVEDSDPLFLLQVKVAETTTYNNVKITHYKEESCIQNPTKVKVQKYYQQNVPKISKVKVLSEKCDCHSVHTVKCKLSTSTVSAIMRVLTGISF